MKINIDSICIELIPENYQDKLVLASWYKGIFENDRDMIKIYSGKYCKNIILNFSVEIGNISPADIVKRLGIFYDIENNEEEIIDIEDIENLQIYNHYL